MSFGDVKAFTGIYDKYWKMMYTVAARKLGNFAEAEELTQDIFMDLWRRRETLEIRTTLSAYLAVSVNYKVLKVIAKRQLEANYRNGIAPDPASTDTITMLEFEEVRERLLQLVNELPEKCKAVFQLSRFEYKSGKEISQQLNMAEKTVESHITKALKHLKSGLELIPFILLIIRG